MGLPLTRELTAAGNTPIPSAAFNIVQDAIIAGKYGPRETGIAAGAFQPKLNRAVLGAGQWVGNVGGGGDDLIAPLPLAVGATISSVTWSYDNLADAGGVSMRLCRRKIDGTAEEILHTTLDNATTGVQQNNRVYGDVVASGYLYYLHFGLANNNAQVLIGASVFHQKT